MFIRKLPDFLIVLSLYLISLPVLIGSMRRIAFVFQKQVKALPNVGIVIEVTQAMSGVPFEQTFVPASIVGVFVNVILAEAVILWGSGAGPRSGILLHWR